MIRLSIPYPPSANRLWRNTPKGTLKSGHYRAWLAEAAWLVREQRPTPLKGSYRLTISAVRPDNRRRDIGNIEKPISDLLVHAGVVEDDHFAKSILVFWSDAQPDKTGGVTVLLEAA